MMTNLEYIICEAEAHGEISMNTRNKLLLALYEKEEDHPDHMEKKEEAEKRLGKSLPNKKYMKNPDKADRYYKGKEEVKKKEPGFTDKTSNISEKDYKKYVKLQRYMRKLANKTDDESKKKYEVANKALHTITKTPQEHSMMSITTRKDKDGDTGKTTHSLQTVSWADKTKSPLFGKLGEKVKLDKSKTYYHSSPVKGIKELRPQREGKGNRVDYAQKDDGDELNVKGSVFYTKGRIYIAEDPGDTYGKYLYKLNKVPDYAYVNTHGYYVVVDEPIPVTQIK